MEAENIDGPEIRINIINGNFWGSTKATLFCQEFTKKDD
jgi:hypothetical protein